MSVHQRITIPTLAGGVGRQASNKRLITEAEELDNVMLTIERSAEKRPPLEFVSGADINYSDNTNFAPGSLLFNTLSSGDRYVPTNADNILFKWISVDQNNRFLIAINFSLKTTDSNGNEILLNGSDAGEDLKKKFITVWKLNTDKNRMDLQNFDYTSLTREHLDYLKHNPDGTTAEKSLSFAVFGSAIIALNNQVSAGYREGAVKTLSNSFVENVQVDTSTSAHSNFRLKPVLEEGILSHYKLVDTNGNDLLQTIRGFPADESNIDGIEPDTLTLTLFEDTDATQSVPIGTYLLKQYKDSNKIVRFFRDEFDIISGRFPSNVNNRYRFRIVRRAADNRGKKLEYRVARLSDINGRNIVPITEKTKLKDLTTKPLEKLYDGTEAVPKLHCINNPAAGAGDDVVGNVKDPNAAVTGDTFFADRFYISRGSVQYAVELNEFDATLVPGQPSLSAFSGTDGAGRTITESNLKVQQKLRKFEKFKATDVVFSDGVVTDAGTIDAGQPTDPLTVQGPDSTLEDLKKIIEDCGADATLSIDSRTNRVSIVDDSQERLFLTASGEQFALGQKANENFVEAMGFGNTNSKSIRTLTKDTLIVSVAGADSINDEDGTPLFTSNSQLNSFEIFDTIVNDAGKIVRNSGVPSFIVNLNALRNPNAGPPTLAKLSKQVRNQTKDGGPNPNYVLCYADNNLEVGNDAVEDQPGENSVGLQILTFKDSTGKKPNDVGFDAAKRTAPQVQDCDNSTDTETNNTREFPGAVFAELIGIRNLRRDHKLVVEDKNFNVATQTDLGQSVTSFQNLPIPTEENDTTKINNAEDALFGIYEGGPVVTRATFNQKGRGKVYECRERFFDFTPGFYRAVSEPDGGNPYYEKVRSEDEYSVWDANTLPIIIDFDSVSNVWKMITPSWAPRTAGNITSNPGPSPFISSTGNERVRRRISAITTWRNRLWFAVGDTVFCSEFGNFFNLFLTDPGTIIDSDVIDIRSSIDKVSNINSMISFYDFLFINTDNDVQFELSGSENQITPFTAELSPTTFYSTDPIARPQLLGSQIYFFAPQKIYLYYSSANTNVLTQAIETTAHCEGYLPKNFGAITRAPTQDLLAMVDADNKNILYFYVNKFGGQEVKQNSLYRYIFDSNLNIYSMESFDNYLYMVTTRPYIDQNGRTTFQYFINRTFLEQPESTQPRLDNLILISPDSEGADATVSYDAATNKSTFILPIQDQNIDSLIFSKD